MRTSRSSFFLRMAVAALAATTLYAQDCDIECETKKNATQMDDSGNPLCIKADADFSDHKLPNGQVLPFHVVSKSPGGYHCVCNEGHTGLACRRSFETCDATDDKAEYKCYHSGKCEEGLEDAFGNKKLFCDCSAAQDRNGTKMIGKYCDHPVERCTTDPLGDSPFFCLNGGKCKADDEITHANPCTCTQGFHGPHCEFTTPVDTDDCDLKCNNDGTCVPGFKNFHQATLMFNQDSFFEEGDYQHCSCRDNTEGELCEHKLTIDGERECGDKYPCQNKGKCIEFKNETTGEVTEGCDCTDANNGTHFFGGKHCQHVSTSFCSLNLDQNGNQFCVNGGTCKEGKSHLGCDCPPGFTGSICDIVLTGNQDEDDNAIDEEAACELDCGDGQCRKGVADLSLLEGFGSELEHIANETNKNFQHCVCPPGLVGPRCEFKVEICGEGQHLCLHGSKCVDKNDKKACDCDQAFNSPSTQFAGAFCQHEASSFCTESGKPATGGQAAKAFCVNGGKCKGKIKDNDKNAEHPGCKCDSDFEGDHCEFKIGSPFSPSGSSQSSSSGGDSGGLSKGGKWAVSLVAVALVAAFSFYVYRKTHLQGKSMDTAHGIETAAPAPTSGPVLNMGPDKDADGNEVTDVEIL